MPADRPHKVLLVDDDPDVSDALATVLGDEGFDVALAADGERGLAALRELPHPPCMILLDIMMPVMDGYTFRDVQRRDPALADIPVVVLTAGTLDQRVQALGAVAVMRKPVDLGELLRTLARYC